MGRRPIIVLFLVLAGTFVAAEDAPPIADPGPEAASANATELELAVGSADGSTGSENQLDLVDVSAGLPLPHDPSHEKEPEPSGEPSEAAQSSVPLSAPVPMSAPVPGHATAGGETRVTVEKIKFKWTIMNYNMHGMEWGEPLYSPVFSGKDTPEYQWQIQYYPRGNDKYWKGYSSLYLASIGRTGARPDVTFYLIDKNGTPASVKKVLDVNRKGEVVGFDTFVGHAYLESGGWWELWVPGNRLTIVVEIVFNPDVKGKGQCSSAGHCLAMPYKNNEDNDLYLFVKSGDKVRAHKATLMAHSTWIADKLSRSQRINAINLPDNITFGDLTSAVEAIYAGKVHPADAERLKALADTLGMSKLKALCEEASCKAALKAKETPAA